MKVFHVEHDLPYLPKPNTVELVLSDDTAPPDLTTTAFLIPVCDDGSVIMAMNQRRGIEVPGGHVEPGESLEQAARRELFEEVGCEVGVARPIGYLRMTVHGDKPEGYRYPYPLSYQQFFAGRLIKQAPFVATDECAEPVRVYDLDMVRSPRARIFAIRACSSTD